MDASLPALFLLIMVAVTLILLPRLHDEPRPHEEQRRPTEELHIKPLRKRG